MGIRKALNWATIHTNPVVPRMPITSTCCLGPAVNRVGRQEEQLEPAIARFDKCFGLFRPMCGASIDDQEDRAPFTDQQPFEVTTQIACLGSCDAELSDQSGWLVGQRLQDIPSLLPRCRDERADDAEVLRALHGAEAAGYFLAYTPFTRSSGIFWDR